MRSKYKYFEFFAGVGMARAGLGSGWECLFANDNDELKQSAYVENWDANDLDCRDIDLVCSQDLDAGADLAWASFPCQDLSQAGSKSGIGKANSKQATRSGAVWPFLKLISDLAEEGRHPTLLALENVVGLLSANGGADFRTICAALTNLGYRFGAVVLDASHFVPQSRPRIFVIAIRRDVPLPGTFHGDRPQAPWHSQALLRARATLPPDDAANWVWWTLGDPPASRELALADVIDLSGDAGWDTQKATNRLVGMMSAANIKRLAAAKVAGSAIIGSLYLRMRPDASGQNIQRAEINFGETLGCLRTPKGGASRPRIIVVNDGVVRTRLLSPSEAAKIMGLPEEFHLGTSYQDCFRLIGDGVVPAVVRFLADRLLEPLASHAKPMVGWPSKHKAIA